MHFYEAPPVHPEGIAFQGRLQSAPIIDPSEAASGSRSQPLGQNLSGWNGRGQASSRGPGWRDEARREKARRGDRGRKKRGAKAESGTWETLGGEGCFWAFSLDRDFLAFFSVQKNLSKTLFVSHESRLIVCNCSLVECWNLQPRSLQWKTIREHDNFPRYELMKQDKIHLLSLSVLICRRMQRVLGWVKAKKCNPDKIELAIETKSKRPDECSDILVVIEWPTKRYHRV